MAVRHTFFTLFSLFEGFFDYLRKIHPWKSLFNLFLSGNCDIATPMLPHHHYLLQQIQHIHHRRHHFGVAVYAKSVKLNFHCGSFSRGGFNFGIFCLLGFTQVNLIMCNSFLFVSIIVWMFYFCDISKFNHERRLKYNA